MHTSASFFCVAGATLCDVAFRDVVAGAAFCDVAKVLFPRIAMAGMRKCDTTANIVAGAGFGDCLGSFAKVIFFELCKNGFIRKIRTKSLIFKLKV